MADAVRRGIDVLCTAHGCTLRDTLLYIHSDERERHARVGVCMKASRDHANYTYGAHQLASHGLKCARRPGATRHPCGHSFQAVREPFCLDAHGRKFSTLKASTFGTPSLPGSSRTRYRALTLSKDAAIP